MTSRDANEAAVVEANDVVMSERCASCGHENRSHTDWWDDDNGHSGFACRVCYCDDMVFKHEASRGLKEGE